MKALFWALITALCWGVAPLLEKVVLERVEPLIVVFFRCILLLSILFVFLFWKGKLYSLGQVDSFSLFYIVLGGIFSAVIGQITYFYALQNGEASQVIPLVCIYPLITVLLAAFFLGEQFTLAKVVGTFLIILGIFYLR